MSPAASDPLDPGSTGRTASRITLAYLLFSLAFLGLSEVTVSSISTESSRNIEIALRLFFIACSGGLLTFMVTRELRKRRAIELRLQSAQQLEALGRLAGGVAHDFNNLLTVILGYSDLVIRRLPEDDRSRPDLEAVRRAATQARAVVDQLLTLSRRRVVQPTVIDPNKAVDSLGEVLRRLVGADIDLRVDVAPDAGCVLIDPGQLEQVILNLVVNARDAMQDGGRLTLATGKAEMPDGRTAVALVVRDTGEGMDPETLAHCFEPFFTTKERSGGTGLGLSTVQAIVAQAGGDLTLDSVKDRGTTVSVLLPEIESAVIDVRPKSGTAGGGNEVILLVEDEAPVRSFARDVLEEHGYKVHEAADAVEALAATSHHRFDLLVTDVVMPGMSGVELVNSLEATSGEGMPVVLTSGFAEDPEIVGLMGSVPFLAKPFGASDLLRAVRGALDDVTGPRFAHGSNL